MKKYYIYALSWENKTKIGYTSNPKQRFGCLCSQAGVKRENATFSFYETTNPRLVEKNCHIMAENSYTRLAGEWFLCSHAQAISIILSNVTDSCTSVDENPRLDKLMSDIKTSLTAGVCSVLSSDFKFSETDFGDITTIKIDNKNWFLLSEIMGVIGYLSSPSDLTDRLKREFNKAGINPDFQRKIKVATNNGVQTAIAIDEMALFEILSFNRSENATRFRSWIIQNVLCGMVEWKKA